MIDAGWSYIAVAHYSNHHHKTIRALYLKLVETGSATHARTGVRQQRMSTARADRRLVRMACMNLTLPATFF